MSHLHGQSEKLLIHILRRPLRMVILRILRKIKNKHISLSLMLCGGIKITSTPCILYYSLMSSPWLAEPNYGLKTDSSSIHRNSGMNVTVSSWAVSSIPPAVASSMVKGLYFGVLLLSKGLVFSQRIGFVGTFLSWFLSFTQKIWVLELWVQTIFAQAVLKSLQGHGNLVKQMIK